MTKVIIVTHGPLAEALKESSKMFFAEQSEKLGAVGLYPEDSPSDLFDKLKENISDDENEEYLFLVDIFGGTPFNTIALLMEEYQQRNIQCLTGVNMPLLMEVIALYESISLDDLLSSLEAVSKDSIVDLRKALEI